LKKLDTKTSAILALALSLLVALSYIAFYKKKEKSLLSINAMSFNVRYDNPDDGENAWNNRKNMVTETIRFHKIDVAGLQEVLHNQVEDLEARLPEYGWFGVGRDDGLKNGEYTPVFYLKSRFDVLNQSTFWLSETPEAPGKLGWDAACPRIVTWGKFRAKSTGTIVFVFNTHFDHVGETARIKSVELILQKIDELAGSHPVILTGDFNCRKDDHPYFILTSDRGRIGRLSDTFDISQTKPYGSTQTYNGFRDEIMPGYRIDFIFVRGISQVLRYGVISEKWDRRFASDHYPVIAEISISK